MTTANSNTRSFKIKPKKIIINNTQSLIRRSVRTLDGLAFPKPALAGGYQQDFILVGKSYQKISNVSFSDKFIDDLEDISNLIFKDVNTYIAYILSRSSVIFLCIHSLALSVVNSTLLNSLIGIYDTIAHLSIYKKGKITSIYKKLEIGFISFIENVWEKYELLNDYILSDIINELITLLKIARKAIRFLVRLTVTPVLTILVLSIATVGVSASTIDTKAINGGGLDQSLLFAENSTQKTDLELNLNPIQISESDYTINFSTLKQDLQKAAQNDLPQSPSTDLNNLYTFKIGDNLDNLSARWGVDKDYILLSNLDINFYDNNVDIVNKSIFIPSEKSIWLKISKDVSVTEISKVLGLSTATILTWQPNSVQTTFNKGSEIVIVNTEPEAIINQTKALIENNIIETKPEVFDRIVTDFNTRKQIALDAAEAERVRQEEEAKRLAREEEERIQAEKAEAERVERENAQKAEAEAKRIAEAEAEAKRQADIIANQNVSVWPTTGTMSRCNLSYHPACDIANSVGTSIVAFRSGTVKEAGWKSGGFGNMVLIDHGGGITSIYMHMSSVSVYAGQYVVAGQYLGGMGSTGNSTGSHLHFSTFLNGVEVSPLRYLVWR